MKEELISRLVEEYCEGKSTIKMAKEYGLSRKWISKELKHRGVEVTRKGRYFIRNRKYVLNEKTFERIDTPNKAYILGLLFADGYVYEKKRFGVELCLKDFQIIEDIRRFLKADYPIKSKEVNGNEYHRLSVFSKKLVNDLIDKGCIPNKSLILKFPSEEQVPQKLIYHFVRGVIDGDGHICFHNKQCELGLTGEFLFIKKCFKTLSLPINKESKAGNARTISIHGNVSVYKAFKKIYKEADMFLSRKYKMHLMNPLMIQDVCFLYIAGYSYEKY